MANLKVFIDTNALPRHPSQLGKGFLRLCNLSEDDVLQIFLSEVVVEEWKSQWLADFVENHKVMNTSFRKFLRHPWTNKLNNIEQLKVMEDVLGKIEKELETISEQEIQLHVKQMHAEIIKVAEHHGSAVIRSYFTGSYPFKKTKSKEDFPDAFVFQSAMDVASRYGKIYFISADKTLKEAIKTINDAEIFIDINEFVQSSVVLVEARKVYPEREWQEMLNLLRPKLPTIEDKLTEIISSQEPYIDQLSFAEVSHPQIPSDNSEARIEGVYEPENITFDWDNIGDFGTGLISIPATFDCKAEITFDVYLGDAYSLPEEVWVDLDDPETHTFFNAGTVVKLRIIMLLTVQFDWEKHQNDEIPTISQIEVEEIQDIIVLEDSYSGIFNI